MVKYIALCIMLAAGYIGYTNIPESHGPGVTAKEPPKISRITWQQPFTFKGANLTPTKVISAEVRVLKRQRYYFDDFSRYSPIDALVGWNELSDERNLDYIFFSLSNRSFELKITRPPLQVSEIYDQTDLWHLIPSSSEIENRLASLRNGNIIYIKGLLVNLSSDTHFDFVSASGTQQNKHQGFNIWVEELNIR